MNDPRDEPPILRVHGSRFPSDPVEIFGTTTALERLINALIDAVNVGRSRCLVSDADGSDSEVGVARLDGRRRAEDWRRSGSPSYDVEDPVIARILDLTAENDRLRQVIRLIKAGRKAGASTDRPDPADGHPPRV